MPVLFQLDRSRIGIVPGTTETARLYGMTQGPVKVRSSFPGVRARYDAPSRTLSLTGVARGSGTVSLVDASGATASTAVLVAPPAGILATDVSVELAGNVTPSFVAARLRDAVAQSSTLQPFVDVRPPVLQIIYNGARVAPLTIPLDVSADGKGTFVDVRTRTNARLRIDPPAPPDAPQTLLYSDSPEYVTADGVLFRSVAPVTPGRPARVYLYHVAMTEPRTFALVLRARGDAASHVALTGAAARPSTKYLCTGHRATADYLREVHRRESVVGTVTPGHPFVFPLQGDMHVRELLAAAYDVAVLDGGAVEVEVVSTAHGVDPLSIADDPEAPADRSRRKGEFSLAAPVRPISMDLRIGSTDEEPSMDIGLGSVEGAPEFPNVRAGPRFFPGDYGIVRPVRLHLVNTTDTPQTAYLYEVPLNRALTSTFWFDGDLNPTEVPTVGDPNQRYLVRAFPLAPREDRTVTGEYMTDGGSNYTAEYGLSADAPQTPPPWNC